MHIRIKLSTAQSGLHKMPSENCNFLHASDEEKFNRSSMQSRNGNCSKRHGKRSREEEKHPVYTHHYIVDERLCGQIIGAGGQSINEIKDRSAALVYLDNTQTPLEGLRTFVIRGTLAQVDEAVRLISQKVGSQGSVSKQAQDFWLQWVQHVFRNMESQAYFLPPVCLKRVPMTTEMVAGQQVLLLKYKPSARGVTASDSESSSSFESLSSDEDSEETNDLPVVKEVPDARVDAQPVSKSCFVHSGTRDNCTVQQNTVRYPSLDEETQQSGSGPAHSSLPDVRRPTPHDADADVIGHSPVQKHVTGQNVSVRHPMSDATHTDVIQPLPVQETDVIDDAGLEHVLSAFKSLSRNKDEVFFCLSQLKFGMYLGLPCYSAAAAQLPLPGNLPAHLPQSWKQGDFDVLIIHRLYGLITCEIKICGYNFRDLKMSQQDINHQVRKKLAQAAAQVDKAEAVLSHLVSDIAPGLRITKVIVFPNLTSETVEQAIGSDPVLTQDLGRCLAANPDPAEVSSLILCSEQLDVSKKTRNHRVGPPKFQNWWQLRVTAHGPDLVISHNISLYKKLVARFCGPSTAVTIPCLSHPRLSVKTLDQVVSATGLHYAQIALFPEQVALLQAAPPRVFLAGPPGTGKSVMLQLRATEWMRNGNDVIVLSTWDNSRLACSMLYNLLRNQTHDQRRVKSDIVTGQVHLQQFDFWRGKDQKKALEYFRQTATDGCLHIVVDEAGPDYSWPEAYFQTFCKKLLECVPRLHLWAASCTHEVSPWSEWHLEIFNKPLRCPPVVVREVEREKHIFQGGRVKRYARKWDPTHTNGPPLQLMKHGVGHPTGTPLDCFLCGKELAEFLKSLRVGQKVPPKTYSNSTPFVADPPALRYQDVIILCVEAARDSCGLIEVLLANGIPVKVMKDSDVEDVATARSDVTWVAGIDRVRGLEKKVVVCVGLDYVQQANQVRLYGPSRCSSQLVWLVSQHEGDKDDRQMTSTNRKMKTRDMKMTRNERRTQVKAE